MYAQKPSSTKYNAKHKHKHKYKHTKNIHAHITYLKLERQLVGLNSRRVVCVSIALFRRHTDGGGTHESGARLAA
jgi:hypothetical protein